jgi:hypothetical protein
VGDWEWIPLVGARKAKCKVKALLLDDGGKAMGSDVSDKLFTIDL